MRKFFLSYALASVLVLMLAFASPVAAESTPAGTSESEVARTASGNASRSGALSVLDRIARAGSPGLRIWTNEGEGRYELGDHLRIKIDAERAAYLTVIHIDSHGVATLLLSGDRPADAHIDVSGRLEIPARDTGFQIHASLPTGVETIYAIGTPVPVQSSWLIGNDIEAFPTLDVDNAALLANRLEALLTGRSEFDGYFAARFDQVISVPDAGGETAKYAAVGIVDYFASRHRAVGRPKLDLDIKFESGTAKLSQEAKLDLLEVGKALTDMRLANNKFMLVGHTDSVGSDGENMALSVARAAEARRFILANFDAETVKSLEIDGLGESQPLVIGSAQEDLALNRRVTLEMQRESLRGGSAQEFSSVATTPIDEIEIPSVKGME